MVLPAAGGDVIDAQHPWDGPRRIRHGHDHPQEGHPAHPRLQGNSKAGPGPACEGNRNGCQDKA
ncbi:hypothetical protein ABZS61_31415 [Streptomyces sp. NPDC005566]|uniref:hypothetical protein n=1 Tax=Streptomyces sp. NPDC005566 TaxID=3156886 RepID=UPI0033BC2413